MNTKPSGTKASREALLKLLEELTKMLGQLVASPADASNSGTSSKRTEGHRRITTRLVESDDPHERFSKTHTTEDLHKFADRLR